MNKRVIAATIGAFTFWQATAYAAQKDAAFCRSAGDWAAAEMTKHIEDTDRRRLDAVEGFGPVQQENPGFFTFLVGAIYDQKIDPPIEGLEDLNKKIADLHRKFARNLAEDVCTKEFLS